METNVEPPAAASHNGPTITVEHPVTATAPEPATHPRHSWVKRAIAVVVILAILIFGSIYVVGALTTVSTDDAYVNGHVTFVAPRVAGQVMRVFVDDNNRVRKGDLILQLDKEPYQVQVNIAQSAVNAAQSDLTAAQAQVRGLEGRTRSLRYALERAIEDVDNQVALLHSKIASLNSANATLAKTQADYDRAVPLVPSGAVSKEQFDQRKESLEIAQADVQEAMQAVYEVRVGLGLPPTPLSGNDLAQVPNDLDQTFSTVKQAQSALIQSAADLGYFDAWDISPKQMVANFYKQDPHGDINRIYAELARNAPQVKQSETKLAEAQRNLDQAKLNLRYCDVLAEIDGVITGRNVNPGNNVIAGQSVMAIRSLTDIWIDANFKETQLARLRIGQSADLDVDMYGSRQRFEGRISGFTMGTGSTLALLPPENATGNFVKVVQRLPVRIDLVDYDPDKAPLFIGLSVTPTVHINTEPTGPDAGKVLQPYLNQAAPAQSIGPDAAGATGNANPPTTQPERRP